MKYNYLLPISWLTSLLLVLLVAPVYGQAPAWQQAVGITPLVSSNTDLVVTGSAADANGNVYITGSFVGTVAFGNTTLTSAGLNDVFIAKWNRASNQFVWAQRAGGSSYDQSIAIAINGSNVFVLGAYRSTANFGSTVLPNTADEAYLFITKLTDTGTSGTFQWTQSATASLGGLGMFPEALAVSGSNVYLTGYFYAATAQLGTTTLTNAAAFIPDTFIAKLTDAGTSGSFTWVQQISGASSERTTAIGVNGTNVYVAGHFASQPATFGTLTLSSTTTEHDVFVAKLNDAGSSSNFVWVRGAGGTGSDFGNALALSGSSIYVAGSFDSNLALFGSNALSITSGSATRKADAFITKLTDVGTAANFDWAQSIEGVEHENIFDLAARGNTVYAVGTFEDVPTRFGNTTLTSAGNVDIFLTKLTDRGTTGEFTWAQSAGGSGNDNNPFVNVTVSGTSVHVAGSVKAPARFGSILLTGPSTSSIGFLASMTDNLVSAAAIPAAHQVTWYPNPAHSTIHVVGTSPHTTLTLVDPVGRHVRQGTGATLSVQDITPGMYLLQIASPGQSTRKARVLVE